MTTTPRGRRASCASTNPVAEALLGAVVAAITVQLGVTGGLAVLTWCDPPPRAREHGYAGLLAMRSIAQAQRVFMEQDRDRDGREDPGSLTELAAAGLIDAELGGGRAHGYVFACRVSRTEPGRWMAIASPIDPQGSGMPYLGLSTWWRDPCWRWTGPIALNDACELPGDVIVLSR